jgi:hypothetical protein
MYVVETRGPVLEAGNKCVCLEARLVSEVRGWNALCIENTLREFRGLLPALRKPIPNHIVWWNYHTLDLSPFKLAPSKDRRRLQSIFIKNLNKGA